MLNHRCRQSRALSVTVIMLSCPDAVMDMVMLVQRRLLGVSRCCLGSGGALPDDLSCCSCSGQPEPKRDQASGDVWDAEGRSSRVRLHQVSNPV